MWETLWIWGSWTSTSRRLCSTHGRGGMTGGYGTADVLTGKVSPSGKLADTIAYKLEDYPSDKNFGNLDKDVYEEDIYVGYRYFETGARDKVRYPFGFGLSYTDFSIKTKLCEIEDVVKIQVQVSNTGSYPGKEVVQIYVNAPQENLESRIRFWLLLEKQGNWRREKKNF